MRYVQLLLVALVVASSRIYAASDETDLSGKVLAILNEKCTKCHGDVGAQADLKILDYKALISGDRKYVVPGDTASSFVLQRAAIDKDMPPDKPLTSEEIGVLQSWIKAGAPDFSRKLLESRRMISVTEVFEAVSKDLTVFEQEDQPFQRYYSLAHLHNNPLVTSNDLNKFRAALSKLINSLSWKQVIVHPKEIDDQKTILRIDLRDVGWDEDLTWVNIISKYPYGLKYDSSLTAELSRLAKSVYASTGTDLPIIRADWFVVAASQPPLYHDILRIPKTATALESLLDVRVEYDFQNNRLRRAGFLQSAVSKQNRLVDRHQSRYGAYWKSYDFGPDSKKGNIQKFPLGPHFSGYKEFQREAFQEDGGEIIFSLPNGLQAYMIVGPEGVRIDKAPTDVVVDSNAPAGNAAVINGLSCIVCHKNGLNTFVDVIRLGHAINNENARQKIERLYPAGDLMNTVVAQDSVVFMNALEETIGQYVLSETDGLKRREELSKLPEPIGVIVKRYSEDLRLEDVVAELQMHERTSSNDDQSAKLRVLFGTRPFRPFGVSVLEAGGRVKRTEWEAMKETYSPFQRVAQALELGKPIRVDF